jgi:guanylate kinase
VLERVPGAVMVLILPPSEDELAARLTRRGDPPQRVRQRLEVGRWEAEAGRQLAHHVIVNDDLARAVSELAGILDGHRRRSSGDH